MDKMMAGMKIKPSGDVDHDFSAMMIPHHQGAIDMAQAELRYGHNEQLRRIAQEIILEQQQEIAAMRLALGQSLPALSRSAGSAVGPLGVSTSAGLHAHDERAKGATNDPQPIHRCSVKRHCVGEWHLRMGRTGTRGGFRARYPGQPP